MEQQIIKLNLFKPKWVSLNQMEIATLNNCLNLEITRCKKHFPDSLPYYQSIKDKLNA